MQRTRTITGHAARLVAWAAIASIVALLAAVTMLPVVTDMRSVAITGRSMTGSMPIGSLAIVSPVPDSEIRAGHVITYDHPVTGARVTHRVTAVSAQDGRPVFRTKGDHNAGVDPWKVQYVDGTAWRVRAHVPVLGRVVLAMQAPGARIALVLVPAAVLLALTLRGIWSGPVRPASVTRTGVRA
jgi:signal peptidase